MAAEGTRERAKVPMAVAATVMPASSVRKFGSSEGNSNAGQAAQTDPKRMARSSIKYISERDAVVATILLWRVHSTNTSTTGNNEKENHQFMIWVGNLGVAIDAIVDATMI